MTATTINSNWIFTNQTSTIPSDILKIMHLYQPEYTHLYTPEYTHLYIPGHFELPLEPNDVIPHPSLWESPELTCIGGN